MENHVTAREASNLTGVNYNTLLHNIRKGVIPARLVYAGKMERYFVHKDSIAPIKEMFELRRRAAALVVQG